MTKYYLFWGGICSNWYPARFTINYPDLGDVEFNCTEQHMMFEKARLFGDAARANAILATDSPKLQKQLGRQVAGYDEAKWAEVRFNVVVEGNLAKFRQNDDLRERFLRDTAGKTIVEASPYDTVWGIGLAANDPRALDETLWRGSNLLGQVLDEVHVRLLADG